jgi:hypothetical protein
MTELLRPGLVNRWAAGRRKEISSLQLEAYRRAGAAVYDLHLVADRRRHELIASGTHPFDADPSTASLFLCAWNARVHQALACELLDSDYREDPRTRGFVPPLTYGHALALFGPVQGWLSAGRRAEVARDFWIGDEVDLPIGLPNLRQSRFGPRKAVRGLLTAGDVLHGLLEELLGSLSAAGPPPPRWQPQLDRVTELAAQAHTALRYAQGLWHPHSTGDLDAVILGHVLPAMVLEHHLGQFLALPELVDRYRSETDRPLSAERRGWATP